MRFYTIEVTVYSWSYRIFEFLWLYFTQKNALCFALCTGIILKRLKPCIFSDLLLYRHVYLSGRVTIHAKKFRYDIRYNSQIHILLDVYFILHSFRFQLKKVLYVYLPYQVVRPLTNSTFRRIFEVPRKADVCNSGILNFYFDFLTVGLKIWWFIPQPQSDNCENCSLIITHFNNFNPDIGVFLEFDNCLSLHIIIANKNYHTLEGSFFLFVNIGDV